MRNTRQIIPLGGLVGTVALALCIATQLHAQTKVSAADFTNAANAEVQDAQGLVVLSGQFAVADEQDDDDVERKATLRPTGADADAAGEAEIEFAKSAPAQQEIEFSVRNLAPGTSVTFLIDGQIVGQASVDNRGRAELELDLPVRGAAASR
ncbi:MAG TPA: hypothetical protein VFS23_13120 [Vicinamibacterales bacterium]|nr:hypothetical protein [Vicinamibacterales bacterium]